MSTITFPKTSNHTSKPNTSKPDTSEPNISDLQASDSNSVNTGVAICKEGSALSHPMPAEVTFRLINYEIHQNELKDVPMFRMEDLALVFYQKKDTDATETPTARKSTDQEILVSDADLLSWHRSPGQLLRDTMNSMMNRFPAKFMTLSSAIGLPEGGGDTAKEEFCQELYVLSNRQGKYGAAVIFYPGVLRRIAKTWGSGFYLIPSSVHELILIPDPYMIPIDDMRSIISEINQQELTFDEILSDQVYHYNSVLDRVVIADHDAAAAANP